MGTWESTGRTDEWYTPKYIFDALQCHFDLDVAAPRIKTHVPANEFIHENSLEKEWRGFVWMNPPYGGRNSKALWLDKFFAHGDGIALVPDRTSAPWFQNAANKSQAILFVAGKIKFQRQDGTTGKHPGNGTALIAVGDKGVNALLRGSRNGLGFYCEVKNAVNQRD